MLHVPCLSRLRSIRLLACALLTIGLPCAASPVSLNTWYQFGFSQAGVPATGCDPADLNGPFCIGSSGTPTVFAGAPPWTFTAPTPVSLLITDAFTSGDRFQIFDFGVSLGLTSVPGVANCGDDPVPCFATAGMSKAVFSLATGNHSLTITPTLSPSGGGTGYFLVTNVPEPATCPLTLLSLALIATRLTRRGDVRDKR